MYHGQKLIIHHGHTTRSRHYRPCSNMVGSEKPCMVPWSTSCQGRRRREKKQWLLSYFLSWLLWRLVLAEQKLLDAKDPFGGNVLKNPAIYIFHCYGCTLRIVYDYANPLTAVLSQGCLQAGSIFGQK